MIWKPRCLSKGRLLSKAGKPEKRKMPKRERNKTWIESRFLRSLRT